MSIGEHRHRIGIGIRIYMAKKPIVSITYENERISIKNSLPYIKCVLRLSCVVYGPIYGRFMGYNVNCFTLLFFFLPIFVNLIFKEETVYSITHKTAINCSLVLEKVMVTFSKTKLQGRPGTIVNKGYNLWL